MRSCGISFNIWEKVNADVNGSGLYEFTSLLWDEKKKLLKELPSKLEGAIQPDTASTVIQIWNDFNDLYT